MVVCASGSVSCAQSATSLGEAKRLFVGSLGSDSGGEELRKELIKYLKKAHQFKIVDALSTADAVLEGQGELWVRGYHALSPRARKNDSAAEAVYSGYLSVRVRGADGQILWSYFADPRRVSIHDLKRDLVDEVTDRLYLDRDSTAGAPVIPVSNDDQPAILSGGGATFPSPIYEEWLSSFARQHPAWKFSYKSLGSLEGVKELVAGKLDFAGSDIPPGRAGLPTHDVTSFPTVGGAVVLIYNLPGVTSELRLSGQAIAEMLSGRIRVWNDPELEKLNPSAALPNVQIQPFMRSDGSGTTYALTEYLSQMDGRWKQDIGASASVQWAAGIALGDNRQVAEAVAKTPFSVGYVEFLYAFQHHLPVASVLNRSGRFIRPGLLAIMAAANQAGDRRQDSDLTIVNSGEPMAYPISTLTWLIVRRGLAGSKQIAMREFLSWMLTAGQRECSGLGYAPLPRNLVDQERSLLQRLQ